jgi:DNA replication protein DnaC
MPKCTICNDSTFIRKVVDGEEIWVPCECRRKKDADMIMESRLTHANIRKSLRGYTFDDYLRLSQQLPPSIIDFNKPRIEILKSFINNPKEFLNKYQALWIWGKDSCSGHTSLIVIFGIELLKLGYKVRFIEMQQLLDAFVQFDEKNLYFNELSKFNVYIIDDIFDTSRMIAKGKYTQIHLFQFLNTALNDGKHFIMSSNIPISQISEEFEQSKLILERSNAQLELRGSFSTILSMESILK